LLIGDKDVEQGHVIHQLQ